VEIVVEESLREEELLQQRWAETAAPPQEPLAEASNLQSSRSIAAAWLDFGFHTKETVSSCRSLGLIDEALGAEQENSRILVLSELNSLLVWREYDGASRADSASGIRIHDRHMLHFRPGALELVAALIGEPTCCFAIVSCMGLYNASPILRLLLENAIPGSEWVVDEVLDGKWTDNKATFTIEGMTLRWENDHNGNCRETCLDLSHKTERTFAFEWPRGSEEVYNGVLTVDGFLELKKTERDEADSERVWPHIWCRSGQSVPPCFVRRDLAGLAGQEWLTFFPQEGNAEWSGEPMKELNKVWSALSECKAGKFSEHNTLIIDEAKAGVSHPLNVLAILSWKYWGMYWDEEKERRQMDELRRYVVDGLLAIRPTSVPRYLEENPCVAFEGDAGGWRD
jgi:hypothetical protein